MIFWIILAVIVLFFVYLCVNAFKFKAPTEEKPEITEASIDESAASTALCEMIRCKTVSSKDPTLTDESQFVKFRELLKNLYPNVHKTLTLEYIGPSGILYKLSGAASDKPSVLMSHYDVVPANEASWEKAPFDGIIEDGILWGRGTIDTKITLCGIMSACENILSQEPAFKPANDIYFAFSGDEEIAGKSAPAIVEALQSRGIKPALVVDEGGAVVTDVFPGVKEPCALIGIAEKGMLDVKFSIDTAGGHASAPPAHTSVGLLSRGVVRVEKKVFKYQYTKAVSEMFDTLGRHSSFLYKIIFSNIKLFMPLLNIICKKKGGELNGIIRTTTAFTQMQGSNASNVIPPSAWMVANMRLAGGDTIESCIEYLKKVINDDNIKITALAGMNPSKISLTGDDPSWLKLKAAVSETWPEAIVSPYTMIACSDSRHYCQISDNVYRFSAAALTKEERATIHGNNERIPVEKIIKTVQFYYRLIKKL